MILSITKTILRAFLSRAKPRKQRKFRQDIDLANKQKGDKYEIQIKNFYKHKGYKIYPNGAIKGIKDGGIDLIAHNGDETILIQCKNWEHSQVKQEHLRIFLGDCTAFLEKNHHFYAKRNIRRTFVTSCQNIDYGVKKFVNHSHLKKWELPN